MTILAATEGGPAVVNLECPDCHAEWEAFGTVDDVGEFYPRTKSDMYCSCGTKGLMKGAPIVVGNDPDRAIEIAWEREHCHD